MLLTTLPVTGLVDALERVQWYARRWGIEVFHRILKSGCQIEDRQLGTADRLEACLAIDAVVAWRIHYLTWLGRATPDPPCTVAFEADQWKAVIVFKTRKPPPGQPPSLRQMIRSIAQLGGFLARKSDGEPGKPKPSGAGSSEWTTSPPPFAASAAHTPCHRDPANRAHPLVSTTPANPLQFVVRRRLMGKDQGPTGGGFFGDNHDAVGQSNARLQRGAPRSRQLLCRSQ
jgi:hypothetical protein